jgi:hypothetical protein
MTFGGNLYESGKVEWTGIWPRSEMICMVVKSDTGSHLVCLLRATYYVTPVA